MKEITFTAPTGTAIAGAVQTGGEGYWPVEWNEHDGRAMILDYIQPGPDSPDWETVSLDDEAVFVDDLDRPWLARHLILAGSAPLSPEAVEFAQRDYYAASAARMAAETYSDLVKAQPVKTAPILGGPVDTLSGLAERVKRDAELQAEQLKRAWLKTLAEERAAGRGVPLPPVYGDEEEDQEADNAKWFVSAEIGIPGPDGGTDSYAGWFPLDSDDIGELLLAAETTIRRRYGEGTRIFRMTTVPPKAGDAANA
jgi:hypothetical protein